jgi:phosphotransferase system HPr-like phosphotransfer protein
MKHIYVKLATDIVHTAQQSVHNVYIRKGKICVDAKSILGLMSLVSLDDATFESEDADIVHALEAFI